MKKHIFLFLIFPLYFLSSVWAQEKKEFWSGENYHQNSTSQKNAAADLMSHISLEGSESILDVGCGDGKITAKLAEKTDGKVLGVDSSLSMIGFAEKQFSGEKYPNLAFELKDAVALDFENEFDCLLSFTVLQWVPDHQAFIQGARKSLKEKGKLGISLPLGLPVALEQAVDEIIKKEKWSSYFQNFSTGWNFPTKESFKELLQKNHFSFLYDEVVDH